MKMKFLIGIFSLAMAGCGGLNKSKKQVAENIEIKDAFYLEEIGGTPEAGIAQHFVILLESTPDKLKIDSLHLENNSLSLQELEDNQWRGKLHFGKGERVPRGVLNGRLSGSFDGEIFTVPVDSIYMKERVVLP